MTTRASYAKMQMPSEARLPKPSHPLAVKDCARMRRAPWLLTQHGSRRRAMLARLADDEGTNAADVLDRLVRRAYGMRFHAPPTTTRPTLRGIFDDIARRRSSTLGNIAVRTGLHIDTVLRAVAALESRSLVRRVEGRGINSVWAPSAEDLGEHQVDADAELEDDLLA